MTHPMRQRAARALLCLATVVLAGCAGLKGTQSTRPWDDAQQMVVVTTAGWDANTGTLQRYERAGAGWRALGEAAPITVGRSGSGWGVGLHAPQSGEPQKVEGDGRAPAGVFRIGTAFGYADSWATAWPYQAMTASDYCIDVNASPLYNRIVDARQVGADAVAGSTEPMRRDLHANGDQRYKLGFVIEHNPDNRSGTGSCIFAHLWKAPGETTAGCTAMAEPVMQQLLAWLDPKRKPVFVLLPADEYRRLQKDWHLP
ncbi:L,D-transpeptidase [Lysobacter sp. GCM10012299]|uniref:L,D-transpeptidase family protein n=1 Tax=Lysobacter sp. GCM10012299 TaxID=3317333 RepID=UPI00361A3CB5